MAEGLRSRAALLAGIALVFSVGLLDGWTGHQFGCSIFYILPILLVSWACGRVEGVVVAGLAAGTWLVVDLQDAARYAHPALPYWNGLVRFSVFLLSARLVDRLKTEYARARLDPLTGIANRHAFFEAAVRELDRFRRYPHPLTVAYLDVDDFKSVNDTRGHAAGDDLLRRVASTLREHLRSTDTVARLGGDEFGVLLPETTAEAARELTRKLQELLAGAMHEERYPVTFSLGAVTFLAAPGTVDELLSRADQAMYAVKKAGKNATRLEVVEPVPA